MPSASLAPFLSPFEGRGAEPPGLAEGKPEDRLREAEWG